MRTSSFLTILYTNLVGAQSCYYPNGGKTSSNDAPCGSGLSGCCPLNWQCLSNGLCYLPTNGYFGRYTCTDQSWKSDGCPLDICTFNNTAPGNEAVLKCPNGKYCCDGNRASNCCQNTDDDGFFDLADGKVVATITNTGSPSKVPTSSASASSKSSPVSSPAMSSSIVPSSPVSSSNTISNTNSVVSSRNLAGSTSIPSTFSSSTTSGSSATDHSITPTPIGATQTDRPSKLPVILGTTLGVLFGLICGLVGFCLYRRRKAHDVPCATPYKFSPAEVEYKPAVPYGEDSSKLRPLSEIDGCEVARPPPTERSPYTAAYSMASTSPRMESDTYRTPPTPYPSTFRDSATCASGLSSATLVHDGQQREYSEWSPTFATGDAVVNMTASNLAAVGHNRSGSAELMGDTRLSDGNRRNTLPTLPELPG